MIIDQTILNMSTKDIFVEETQRDNKTNPTCDITKIDVL